MIATPFFDVRAEKSTRARWISNLLYLIGFVILCDRLILESDHASPTGTAILFLYMFAGFFPWKKEVFTLPHFREMALAAALLTLGFLIFPGDNLFILGAILLGMVRSTVVLGWTSSFGNWVLRAFSFAILYPMEILVGFFYFMRDTFASGGTAESNTASAPAENADASTAKKRHFILLWGIPIALSLVFLILFTVNNPILRDWLGNILDPFFDLIRDLNFERLFAWGFFFSMALAWSMSLCTAIFKAKPAASQAVPDIREKPWFPVMAGNAFLLFNLLFLLNNVNLIYVAMNDSASLVQAAFDAQRAAYPLIGSVLLAAAFVLCVFRNTESARQPDWKYPRIGVMFFLAQNAVLVLLTALQLCNYVAYTHALTEWRLATFVWLGLILAGLLLVAVKLKWEKPMSFLLRANVRMVFVVLLLWSVSPVGYWIADYNIKHAQSGELDTAYLCRLVANLDMGAGLAVSRALKENKVPPVARSTLQNSLNNMLNQLKNRKYASLYEYYCINALEKDAKIHD